MKDICIVDAGARFGIHESWIDLYRSESNFNMFLFDADPIEHQYLSLKYENDTRIKVNCNAVGEKYATDVVMTRPEHPGGSSLLQFDNSSLYWKKLRPGTSNSESSFNTTMITIDGFAKENNLKIDFLKVDVEGYEEYLIQGAEEVIRKDVLGVRCETLLNGLYLNQQQTFSITDKLLRQYGLVFLNFDSKFSNSQVSFCDIYTGDIYGQLISLDGIWVRGADEVIKGDPIDAVKYSYFCLKNNARDLAFYILLELSDNGSIFVGLDPNLVDLIEAEVSKCLFSLRDKPRYGMDYLTDVFNKIFGKKWIDHGEYYYRYPTH